VHPDLAGEVGELHKRRLSGKWVPNRYETCLIKKTGEKVCCEVRVKKIIYKGRKAFLLNILGLDEKKEEEARLIRSEKRDALVRMAAGLAQKIRKCVGPLSGLTRDMREKGAPEDRSLSEIEAVIRKGEEISDQLDILAGMAEQMADGEVFDLRKIVKEAVSQTKIQLNGEPRLQSILFKTYLRSVSPVKGHPEEIRGALSAIISNAIEAVKRDGEIYLSMEEEAGYAHVYIQDSGPGMDEGLEKKIFDPFFSTKKGSRTGLGLSLAHAIISRHNGEIEVINQRNAGTTFIVTLPLARRERPPKKKRVGNRIKGSRILLIADESMVKDLLSKLFESKGGKIISTSSSREGLRLLQKRRFDLVIADPNTPYLKLSEVIPLIRAIRKDLPVALVNAPSKGKTEGADLVIGRPLDMDKTLSMVSALLAG
jgi:nitrogen-specific signal transduction histidine kinase/CheY-like chemotaxis protein